MHSFCDLNPKHPTISEISHLQSVIHCSWIGNDVYSLTTRTDFETHSLCSVTVNKLSRRILIDLKDSDYD